MLSDEEIERVRAEIDKSAIFMQSLKDDLLDHFCCFIEHEMRRGLTFEEAYGKALREVYPNGLDEIQQETIFLLNITKIKAMKKTMYLIGLLSSMSIAIGWMFKLMHLPGGDNLFTYGFLALVLLFLPMVAFDRYKFVVNKVLSEKLKLLLGFASALVSGVAVVFKLMHLQGADVLLIAGAVLFIFGYLPFLFFGMYKKAVSQ